MPPWALTRRPRAGRGRPQLTLSARRYRRRAVAPPGRGPAFIRHLL